MSSLIDYRTARLRQAPILYGGEVDIETGIFPRPHAKIAALGPASPAVIVRSQSQVGPVRWSPIKRIAEDEPFAGTVTDVWNQESRGTLFFRWKRGIRQVQNWNRKQAEPSIFQPHRTLHVNRCFGREKFPGRPL